MAYPIEEKLVIAVASSALFALDEADTVFRNEGVRAYREYQREHENDVLSPGIAFPFVRRFLELNTIFPERQPAEVVLLSRNDSDTGMRVFNSIEHYDLGIIRAAFTRGNKLGNLRNLEDEREESDLEYKRFLKTSIVTARSAPAHRRVIHTLRSWNITVDETHFLGGMDKGRILETLKPHIFFDDQQHPHLDAAQKFTPSVHIPFGIAAKK